MAAPGPVTTLVPFATLPACAQQCGPLFDVNGACVPTTTPATDTAAYEDCFCRDTRLSALQNNPGAVCPGNVCQQGDLSSVQAWYTSFCANKGQATSTSAAGNRDGVNNGGGGGGGTWLDSHYQWVIFLVIMVVGIVGIWIGACVWRRRYLRKKDRQYALGNHLAHATESGRVLPNSSNAGSLHVPAAGMFSAAPLSSAGVYDNEKPQKAKKKWTVRERT